MTTTEPEVKWSQTQMVEVPLNEPDDFLKVRETLTRIGVASRKEKKLYQSCHILHKQGRYYIVHFKELRVVDDVLEWDDSDGSACGAIQHLLDTMDGEIVFANGGDREKDNTPELDRYVNHDRVNFAWGVGGHDKSNSSSWILKNYYGT